MVLWKPFRGDRTGLDSVEKHDGYVYWCIDDGSLHFDYTDADGNLQRKQINAKDAETLTGVSLEEIKKSISWNDLTDKPFYSEPPVTTTKVIISETSYEGFVDGTLELSITPIDFKPDTEYTITWDGVEYTVITEKMINIDIELIMCGNLAFITGEDNGLPFTFIYAEEDLTMLLFSDDTGATSHTFGITQTVTTQEIHKLDDKYINAEWLPQKTMIPTVGVVETTMTVKDTGENILPSESYDMNALESAEYCDVLWNGTTYKCVPQMMMGITLIGNMSLFDSTIPDSGEPFLFGCADFIGGVVPLVPPETEATFSITCYNSAVVSTMPHEYLPEPLQFGYEHEAEVHKEVITWDGDTTGRATLEALQSSLKNFYHVSSSTPTVEEASNGGVVTGTDINGLNTHTFTFDANMVRDIDGLGYSISSYIFIVSRALSNYLGLPAGIYFYNNGIDYVSSFSIDYYTFVEKETKIKTIDPKCLPEGIGGGSGLPEVSADDNGKTVKVVDGDWSVEKLSYNDLSDKPIPDASAVTNGAFLRVVNNTWAAVVLPNAEEGEF